MPNRRGNLGAARRGRGVPWTLVRIGGTRVTIDPSWLIIFAFVTFTSATAVLPARLVRESFEFGMPVMSGRIELWLAAVVSSVLFFGSLLVHEAAHALVAIRSGIPVRRIRLMIFGGVAEIAHEPTRAGQEFAITVVGPLASAALGGLFLAAAANFAEATLPSMTARWLGEMNLFLAAFNLLPGFPLDGGRLLRSAVWGATGNLRRATRIASAGGVILGFAMMALGAVQFVTVNAMASAMWLVVLGWHLASAARASDREMVVRERLRGLAVRDVVRRHVVAVPADGSAAEFMARGLAADPEGVYPVLSERRAVVGLVASADVRATAPAKRVAVQLGELTHELRDEHTLRLDDRLDRALALVMETGQRQVLVLEEGRLAGRIDVDLLRQILRARAAGPDGNEA
ncbi:MAG: site-2 protease family protein [Actinobacteria bacterium]|nr:site-2 protease family protein [Actinomycetota bacterium]